jgi:hypothetical protein
MGQLASRVADKGVDDRNLGRWAWTQFKGQHGHSTCIVSVYVPCHSEGEETVYKQHRRHLHGNGIMECPRHILLRELRQQLLSWRSAGNRLVVFLDANENMTKGPFYDMLTGEGLYLWEAVTTWHPNP